MARIFDVDHARLRDLRPHIAVVGGNVCQRGDDVQRRKRSGCLLDAFQIVRHTHTDSVKDGVFHRNASILGAEDTRFDVL